MVAGLHRIGVLEKMTNEEVNARIAELKGLANRPHLETQYEEGVTEDGEDGWDGFYCPRCHHHESMLSSTPCYPNWAGDDEKALELLKEMRPHFFSVMLIGWDHTEEWCVEATPRHGHGEVVQRPLGKATTIALAICMFYISCKELTTLQIS